VPATNRGKDGAPTERARRCGRSDRLLHPARLRPWSLPIRRSARRVYGSITLAEPWLSTSKSTIFQSGLRVFTPDSRARASITAETTRFVPWRPNENIFIHFNCLTRSDKAPPNRHGRHDDLILELVIPQQARGEENRTHAILSLPRRGITFPAKCDLIAAPC